MNPPLVITLSLSNLISRFTFLVALLVFVRGDSIETLNELVAQADSIVHLAGENRPADIADFTIVNINLTRSLCEAIVATGRNIPLILASSTQAESDTLYGQSKQAAEQIVERHSNKNSLYYPDV